MTPTPVGMRCPECAKQKTKVKTLGSMASEPRVTYAVIALCVIAFLGSGSFGVTADGSAGSSLYDRGYLAALFNDNGQVGELSSEPWRLITSAFLHAGLLHIGFNMYMLYIFGPELESRLGSVRFGALYVSAALVGAAGAMLQSDAAQGTVGASGAIFGVMAAMFIDQRARGFDPMQSGIGGVILINLVLGFVLPRVSWGGHLGGLVGGALVMLAFQAAEKARKPQAGLAGAVVVGVAGAAVALAVASSKASDLGF